MDYPTEDEVRSRAFELWREAGGPDGQMDTFWYLAEKDLLSRHNAEENAGPPGIVSG